MTEQELKVYPPTVREYLRYMQSMNKSPLTVSGYALDLRVFFRFLMLNRELVPDDTDFNNIDISHLELDVIKTVTLADAYAFLAYCRAERDNSARARARKAVAVKRFYRFLTTQGHIDKNPLQELESPKTKKTLPIYLSKDQAVDLLKCIDGKFRERDYCIITLFLNCGLRLSELIGLNLKDIYDDTMRVTGKGDKERTIYLNNVCKIALNRYLAVRPADGVHDRDALFISRNKRRLSRRAVENIVDGFIKKAGLDGQGFTVHKLRHTAATLMYQYGKVDVLLLKEILGHESLSTTQIYTHVDREELHKAVDSNPLNTPSPADDANDINSD